MKDYMKMIGIMLTLTMFLLYCIISKYKNKEVINYYFTSSLIGFSITMLYLNILIDIFFIEENNNTIDGLFYYSNLAYNTLDYMNLAYSLLLIFFIAYVILPYQLCKTKKMEYFTHYIIILFAVLGIAYSFSNIKIYSLFEKLFILLIQISFYLSKSIVTLLFPFGFVYKLIESIKILTSTTENISEVKENIINNIDMEQEVIKKLIAEKVMTGKGLSSKEKSLIIQAQNKLESYEHTKTVIENKDTFENSLRNKLKFPLEICYIIIIVLLFLILLYIKIHNYLNEKTSLESYFILRRDTFQYELKVDSGICYYIISFLKNFSFLILLCCLLIYYIINTSITGLEITGIYYINSELEIIKIKYDHINQIVKNLFYCLIYFYAIYEVTMLFEDLHENTTMINPILVIDDIIKLTKISMFIDIFLVGLILVLLVNKFSNNN